MKRIIGDVILPGNSSFFPEPSEKIQNIQMDVRNVGLKIMITSVGNNPNPDRCGHHETSQTTTSREIDFSKWFERPDSESTSSEGGAWEDSFGVNHSELKVYKIDPDSTPPDDESCIDLTMAEIFNDGYFRFPLSSESRLSLSLPSCSGTTTSTLLSSEALTDKGSNKPQPHLLSDREWAFLSDREWAFVSPFLSKEVKSRVNLRSVLNSIFFITIHGTPIYLTPKNPDFCKRYETIYNYFYSWLDNGSLEEALILLVKETQDPLQSSYQKLLENFHKVSTSQANPPSIEKLISMCKQTKSKFQRINDKEWCLVEPVLRENMVFENKFLRSILDSIFLILIGGVPPGKIRAVQRFASESSVRRYFDIWRKSETLEKVLDELVRVTQGLLQSDYLNLLKRLKAKPYSETKKLSLLNFRLSESFSLAETQSQSQPTEDAECDFGNPSSKKETEPKLWRISDEAWPLVEPLLNKEDKSRADHRAALNSILFVLINRVSDCSLPIEPNFSKKDAAYKYFLTWRGNGAFEKSLVLLEKEAKEPSKSYYRNLLESFQEISNRKARNWKFSLPSIEELKSMQRPARSNFRCLTDEEWILVYPFLRTVKKSKTNFRSTLNSIFSVLVGGVAGCKIPADQDFASQSSVQRHFCIWRKNGTLEKVLDRLIEATEGLLKLDYQDLRKRLESKPHWQTGDLPISTFKLR